MNTSDLAKGAFEGVNVADFSWVVVGPMIARYLADHGATVVHIESGASPDILRTSAPFKDGLSGINRSANFANYNCNKYGISLNLKHSRAIEVAKRIILWADVVVESFTPGTMARWGLSYEQVRKIKPEIIMISSCNQGQTGPHAKHPGLGMQLVSLAGFTELTGWPDRAPAQPYGAYTDLAAAPLGAATLIAAMDYRRRTAKGLYLDLSQYEASLQFLAPLILDYTTNRREAAKVGNRCPYAAPHGAYPCRGEDRWCVIAVFNDQEWQLLCHAMGNPAWADEPRFRTFLGRKANEDELDNLISKWTMKYSAEHIVSLLQQAGVPAGVVQNAADIHQDPQLHHRNYFLALEHPEIGIHRYDGVPFRLSETPAKGKMMAAPCLGQHNEYVCKELLGMSEDEYVQLVVDGVLQ